MSRVFCDICKKIVTTSWDKGKDKKRGDHHKICPHRWTDKQIEQIRVRIKYYTLKHGDLIYKRPKPKWTNVK